MRMRAPRRCLLAWSALVVAGCHPQSLPTEREGAEPLTLVFEREGAEPLLVDVRLEPHADPLLQAEHVCALTGNGDDDVPSRSDIIFCGSGQNLMQAPHTHTQPVQT